MSDRHSTGLRTRKTTYAPDAPVPDPVRPPSDASAFARFLPSVRRVTATLVCCAPVFVAMAATATTAIRFVPPSGGEMDVVHPATRLTAVVGAFVFLGCGVALTFAQAFAWRPYRNITSAMLVFYAAQCCVTGMRLPEASPPVVAADGATWRLVTLRTQHGSLTPQILVRVIDENLWRTRYEVLGMCNWVHVGALLVRPVRDPPPAGLVAAPDGRLYGVSADGTCLIAHEFRGAPSKRPGLTYYGLPPHSLSPFALLRDDDTPSRADLHRLEERIRRSRTSRSVGGTPEPVVPSDQALARCLAHPNPAVRDATRRLIRAGGEGLYPDATRKL